MTQTAALLGLQHPEAEESIITAMVFGESDMASAIAEQIAPDDFENVRYRIIFDVVRDMVTGTEPVDVTGIIAGCRTRYPKAHITDRDLSSLRGDIKRAPLYVDRLRELAWLRRAADFSYWFAERIADQPDPLSIYAEAQEHFQAITPAPAADGSFLYGDETERFHNDIIAQRIDDFHNGVESPFTWPWKSWNARIRPMKGALVGIIGAPDGMGKSTYLNMIAEHWAQQGQHVVFVHLENNHEYELDRRKARYSGIPLATIEGGDLEEGQLETLRTTTRRIAQWDKYLHYYHAPGRSMLEILRELRTRCDEGVCDAVVFDYLDKVQATRGQAKLFASNHYERQANDMEQLKSFAEEANVPVMTATQGNKDMQGSGTQTRKNIQGSGQKSHKAQLVVILTRNIVTGTLTNADGDIIAEDGDYSPIVNVRIDKQNRGRTGQFQQFLKGSTFAVADYEAKRVPLNE